jgi:hypothetical protein
LKQITLQKGITTIGSGAFSSCSAIESLNYYAEAITSTSKAFESSGANGKIIFYGMVKSLPATLFSGTSFPEIIFENNENGLTIGSSFMTSAKTVHAASLENWCSFTFSGYNSNPIANNSAALYIDNEIVEYLSIPENVVKISKYTFYNYKHLKGINIPEWVEQIDNLAFLRSYNIEEIVVNEENLNFVLEEGYLLTASREELLAIRKDMFDSDEMVLP